MRIKMSRKINIKAYETLAKVAFPEERNEILALLQMVGSKFIINASGVVDKTTGLLPGRPKVMGERLLRTLEKLGLLDSGYRGKEFGLTEYGEETLDNRMIFIPEESSWKIWITEDPLFPDNILFIDRHREPNSRTVTPTLLPEILTKIKSRNVSLIRTHHTNSSELRVIRIQPMGRLSNDSQANLDLIITADEGQDTIARVEGILGSGKGNKIDRRLVEFEAPEHLELFTRLMELSEFGPNWDENKSRLNVEFSETTPLERREHLRTIRIDAPNIEGLGKFNSVDLKAIPLAPKTGYDAREWAEWELWSDFSEQPWPDIITKFWAELSVRYELASHGLSSPPDISARVDSLRSSMLAEQISAEEIGQLRRCQAVIDLGGDSS
jgi:hypothetical protein